MTVICGTDFSAASDSAIRSAAMLARGRGAGLVLVHAIKPLSLPPDQGIAALLDDMTRAAETTLARTTAKLREEGITVTPLVKVGHPESVLEAEAEKRAATTIVVGSSGEGGLHWLLGSTAERLASTTAFPIFVARNSLPVAAQGETPRSLRILVATNLDQSSHAAVGWAAALGRSFRSTFILAHIVWPPDLQARLDISESVLVGETDPRVRDYVTRELAPTLDRLEDSGETTLLVEPNLGQPAAAIARLATQQKADVIVLGRRRDGDHRWWERSVSRGVMRAALCSVACVPSDAATAT